MNRMQNFKNGLIKDNPVFGLYLGLCSTLAITTSINNAIGMGVAVIFVLILSNMIISSIRKLVPDDIRIPVYIVIIATLVKIIQMLIQAYAPALDTSLGVFIPLIVVNCIILGRAEAFASKNGVMDSALDGLGMGLGYLLAVSAMSIIRQILSTGVLSMTNPFNEAQVLFSLRLIPDQFTISMFSAPLGAFMTFACLAASLTAYKQHVAKKEEAAKKAAAAASKEAAK
ncbi:MAG: electron transport complex subunit RsxE [Allobaculum sp.]